MQREVILSLCWNLVVCWDYVSIMERACALHVIMMFRVDEAQSVTWILDLTTSTG